MLSKLLLIDTSYLIFYRFHALKIWFSIAKPEISLETDDISTIPEFMEMYEKTFLQTIEKISNSAFSLSLALRLA